MQALENRDPKTEVVLTGRYAPKQLIAYADLVTDMQRGEALLHHQRSVVA